MPEARWEENLEKLLGKAEEQGIDTLILGSKANIRYTTGIVEPTGLAVAGRDCGYTLITPLLDYHRIVSQAPSHVEVKAAYRRSDEALEADIPRGDLIQDTPARAALSIARSCGGKVAGDLSAQPYPQARILAGEEVEDLTSLINRVRSIKSSWEVEIMVEAAYKAEEILGKVIGMLADGVTEAGIAGEILRLSMEAAEGTSFPPIVAFYSNTAYPHHVPGPTILGVDGPVLIDMGVVHMGYMSDITRTLYKGSPGQGFRKVLEAVAEAQAAAIDRVAPGAEAWEPDKEARLLLARHGLARHFIHGLGHGVGVEIHEEPYLRPGSKTVLEPGMVVTVEPGVYMPGLYGVRIEDMVLVTRGGRRVLTRFARTLGDIA
ncbi:MAG: Xaa-Pro peptidase family protein [Desulfurococcales archaeon]|nr:Xaa-Pro peptidase family protein [Desulfurococcales archaeon]MCE4605458.1 Xaa-Pro peptidase family protein [Desulfurococcales archaeon]